MLQAKVVEKIKTQFLCLMTPSSQIHAMNEVMWSNMVEPQMARQYNMVHVLCVLDNWITKATDTHTISITAFPWQQWLHRHATVLHLYICCLSCLKINFIS